MGSGYSVRPGRTPSMVISPRRGWWHLDLGELWRYRELGYFLVWRDIKVRYKQTLIGALWAVIQPLVLMVVFATVFGRFGGRLAPPPRIPRSVFYFSALLPWTYFASALQNSTNSVLNSQQVVTRIYFPRLLLPLEAVAPAFLDFSMSFVVLLVLMGLEHVPFTLRLLAIPLLLLLLALTAFGAGTWLAATNALYRDVREAVPFLIQVLLFTSPVVLPAGRVPSWFRPIYGLDPVAGVIEAFRWATVGTGHFPWRLLLPGLGVTLLLIVSGVVYFRRVEDVIVDVV